MPEKRTGVFDIIMGVFKSKKEICGDIVVEAENVISNYINCRRNIIEGKYRKKSRFMSFLTIAVSIGILYMIYKLAA